jgi:crotonobetainyl-CoA:carnitine CoA-transferase CaiB-like acyl-CoA transferase
MSSSRPDLSQGPLAGIRVLDLATMLAGPYGATLLGDLGADVIKVESFYGDDSRHLGPRRDGERTSYLSMNRNKRALVLDLREPAARDVFARLAATSDILITNIREPALSGLGLDYEQVRAHRPDIIWIGVTAFGPDGPYAGRPGIDFLAQGYAGLLAMNGRPGDEPVRVTVPLIDVMTSELVCTSALAAIIARGKTGEGQRIDISLLDALVHAQAPNIGCWVNAGEDPPKTGNRSQYFSPSGVFTCGDGKRVVITCPSDKFFRNLCSALEIDLPDDPRFESVELRLENEEALDRLLAERCLAYEQEDLVERLIAADVLTAPIKSIPELVEDPQIQHNGMIRDIEHPSAGPIRVTGVPVHLRGTPGAVRLPPPLQGQHSQELLAELGYAAGEIESLRGDKLVATDADIQEAKEERRKRKRAPAKREPG